MAYDTVVYADGACRGNGMICADGGWGVRVEMETKTHEIYGGERGTTNNKMELTAAIEALKICQERPAKILLCTDSQYVVLGITDWIKKWKRNGWRTSKQECVKNMELWEELDELCNVHDVTWQWVKGHSNSFGNHRADQLANKGIDVLNRFQKEQKIRCVGTKEIPEGFM
jgi:ribonuclease HI